MNYKKVFARFFSFINFYLVNSFPQNSKIVNKEVCICVTIGSCPKSAGSNTNQSGFNVRILNVSKPII